MPLFLSFLYPNFLLKVCAFFYSLFRTKGYFGLTFITALPIVSQETILVIHIFRQHAASIYGFVRQFCFVCQKKMCVSVRWVTLWVRTPLSVSIQLVTLLVRPPSCVSFQWKTIFVGSLHAAYSALWYFCIKLNLGWVVVKLGFWQLPSFLSDLSVVLVGTSPS